MMSKLNNMYYYFKIAGLYPVLFRLFLIKCLACLIRLSAVGKGLSSSRSKSGKAANRNSAKFGTYIQKHHIYLLTGLLSLAGFIVLLISNQYRRTACRKGGCRVISLYAQKGK